MSEYNNTLLSNKLVKKAAVQDHYIALKLGVFLPLSTIYLSSTFIAGVTIGYSRVGYFCFLWKFDPRMLHKQCL